jgi:polyisoprenoid-binding protein YceI
VDAGPHKEIPMKIQTLILPVLLLAACGYLLMGPTAVAEDAPASGSTYAIDGTHSSVLFKLNHLGVGTCWGRFNAFEGTFVFNEANPAASSVNVKIDVNSIDTNNKDRDAHLKNQDYFDVVEHESITFTSTKVEKTTSATHFDVHGKLTMHGVTKPVTIRMELVGMKDVGEKYGGFKCGFDGTLKIKRSDYGMSSMIPYIGDEVTIVLAIEGNRQ